MANVLPQHTGAATDISERSEPADNRMYLNLSIAFLIGIVFLFGMFILILVLLAQAG